MAAVRQAFKPEFLNRLDEVVLFDALTPDELAHIVDLQVAELGRRLAARRITLEVTERGARVAGAHRLRPGVRRPSAAPAGAAAIGDPLARLLLGGEVLDGRPSSVERRTPPAQALTPDHLTHAVPRAGCSVMRNEAHELRRPPCRPRQVTLPPSWAGGQSAARRVAVRQLTRPASVEMRSRSSRSSWPSLRARLGVDAGLVDAAARPGALQRRARRRGGGALGLRVPAAPRRAGRLQRSPRACSRCPRRSRAARWPSWSRVRRRRCCGADRRGTGSPAVSRPGAQPGTRPVARPRRQRPSRDWAPPGSAAPPAPQARRTRPDRPAAGGVPVRRAAQPRSGRHLRRARLPPASCRLRRPTPRRRPRRRPSRRPRADDGTVLIAVLTTWIFSGLVAVRLLRGVLHAAARRPAGPARRDARNPDLAEPRHVHPGPAGRPLGGLRGRHLLVAGGAGPRAFFAFRRAGLGAGHARRLGGGGRALRAGRQLPGLGAQRRRGGRGGAAVQPAARNRWFAAGRASAAVRGAGRPQQPQAPAPQQPDQARKSGKRQVW